MGVPACPGQSGRHCYSPLVAGHRPRTQRYTIGQPPDICWETASHRRRRSSRLHRLRNRLVGRGERSEALSGPAVPDQVAHGRGGLRCRGDVAARAPRGLPHALRVARGFRRRRQRRRCRGARERADRAPARGERGACRRPRSSGTRRWRPPVRPCQQRRSPGAPRSPRRVAAPVAPVSLRPLQGGRGAPAARWRPACAIGGRRVPPDVGAVPLSPDDPPAGSAGRPARLPGRRRGGSATPGGPGRQRGGRHSVRGDHAGLAGDRPPAMGGNHDPSARGVPRRAAHRFPAPCHRACLVPLPPARHLAERSVDVPRSPPRAGLAWPGDRRSEPGRRGVRPSGRP